MFIWYSVWKKTFYKALKAPIKSTRHKHVHKTPVGLSQIGWLKSCWIVITQFLFSFLYIHHLCMRHHFEWIVLSIAERIPYHGWYICRLLIASPNHFNGIETATIRQKLQNVRKTKAQKPQQLFRLLKCVKSNAKRSICMHVSVLKKNEFNVKALEGFTYLMGLIYWQHEENVRKDTQKRCTLSAGFSSYRLQFTMLWIIFKIEFEGIATIFSRLSHRQNTHLSTE